MAPATATAASTDRFARFALITVRDIQSLKVYTRETYEYWPEIGP